MDKTVVIVGYSVREAERHWRELIKERPDLANGKCKAMSAEHAHSIGLKQRTPADTELIVLPRAWDHIRVGYGLKQEVHAFNMRGE